MGFRVLVRARVRVRVRLRVRVRVRAVPRRLLYLATRHLGVRVRA